MWKYCHGEDTIEELKYLACKYGEMQILLKPDEEGYVNEFKLYSNPTINLESLELYLRLSTF